MSVPVTNGTGTSSVAAEVIATQQYQQIKVVGGETGSTSVMGVNPDRSINVSVLGVVQVTGSVVTVGNGSISGTVGASVIGWVPIQASNTSIITVQQGSSIIGVVTGSVVSLQGTNPWVIVGSVYGSGSVVAFQGGTRITSIVSTIPSSVLVGASIFGQLPAGTAPLGSVATLQGTNPWVVVGSVYGAGSVVAFQGGAPWANTNVGSVITTQIGSVITVWQSPSIVGTYAEDAAHATGDKGIFALGVRNDTLSSVTSTDGDYTPISTGPVGETVTANAPITKWIRGTADLRVVLGASVTAIAAQGASIFTYITSIQLANMGSASVLVTFTGGLGSILGYSIAPAGGGSNIYYPNALKTGENSAFAASISGTASVLVSAQGFTAKI